MEQKREEILQYSGSDTGNVSAPSRTLQIMLG